MLAGNAEYTQPEQSADVSEGECLKEILRNVTTKPNTPVASTSAAISATRCPTPIPTPFVKIRRNRVKWTEEETAGVLNGLRKYGKNYSEIRNDKSLKLDSRRRTTDIRARLRVLHSNGQLPEDLRNLVKKTASVSRGAKRAIEIMETHPDIESAIIDIRRGAYDEPVVKLYLDGSECSDWLSTIHFPKSKVRELLLEFIERTTGTLKIAVDLCDSLKMRAEEPIGEHVKLVRDMPGNATSREDSTEDTVREESGMSIGSGESEVELDLEIESRQQRVQSMLIQAQNKRSAIESDDSEGGELNDSEKNFEMEPVTQQAIIPDAPHVIHIQRPELTHGAQESKESSSNIQSNQKSSPILSPPKTPITTISLSNQNILQQTIEERRRSIFMSVRK